MALTPLRRSLFAAALAAGIIAHAEATGPQLVFAPVSPFLPVSRMWQGATIYGTGKPVSVYFVHNIADWGNELNVLDPATGRPIPLWSYHRNGQSFQCPDSGQLRFDLGVQDSSREIVFMLRTLAADFAGKYCTGEACGPRYSGLNDPSHSRYYSRGEYAHLAGIVWSRSTRLTAEQADSLPIPCPGQSPPLPGAGGVLFSFNDGANDTFGDLVFLVTGVEMDVERKQPMQPKPIALATGDCRIEAAAGGVTHGERFDSRPMALPVSAILPRRDPSGPRVFMDQSWRLLDRQRPDETLFPNGPDIKVTTPGPFEFNLGFFTNQGVLVNRAKGQVTADMLASIAPGTDGRRSISLMWYPAAASGYTASTGAYVVKGSVRTLPRLKDQAGERAPGCLDEKSQVLSSFGYIRH